MTTDLLKLDVTQQTRVSFSAVTIATQPHTNIKLNYVTQKSDVVAFSQKSLP
ncbi:hypothetical protein [Tolypothrix sp. VBCCA 56010]|uniref:hypothetical protein n=1 Tax=Tolypothrix sp. VBCCA 56010 TaxID=3137731 RepID=UPI003D7EFD74